MSFRRVFLCYCEDCDEYFTGEEKRWVMYYCPHCKQNGVDIEEDYTRIVGRVVIKKELTKFLK